MFNIRSGSQRRAILFMALQVLMNALVVQAESAAHLSRIHSGGIPGLPVITGITPVTNGVTITWDGPGGNYRLYQKATVTDTQWQPVGDPINLLRSATVTAPSSAGIFKISGPPPRYVGVQACLECHSPVANTVTHTRHFNAFSSPSFAALGGQTDAACLACHTVGFGVPTGFLFNSRTPHLANVQCENCHGPAGLHAANPEDPVTRPRVEIASTMCGGCHNASVPARVAALHPARFEEWSTSGHHEIVPEVKSIFEDPGVNPSTIARCGACHSGSVREALLEGTAPPAGHEAAAIGIACATCHDSHEVSVHTNVLNGVQRNPLTGFVLTNRSLGATYTNQISSPLASLADYHTTGNFATNYNPDINICAQCHNDRGASAKGLDRAPHHSGQYNMLLGSFSEEDTTIPARQPATHALLEKQCVSCHMQTANGTSGHTFAVKSFGLCAECHAQPEALVQFTKTAVMYQIQRDKSALDFWATNKAPPALRKYGARAWEYVNPGSLSGAGPSPTLAEQSAIPPSIQKARFMVYMVLNEGSFGVHNGPYTTDLLTAAYNLVVEELGK